MPSVIPSISLFVGIFICYSVGLILAWLSSRILELVLRRAVDDSEKRLRTEMRDDISRIILEVLESGKEPTLPNVAELCPTHFRTGNAWVLWQRESHQMLKDILAEDLAKF